LKELRKRLWRWWKKKTSEEQSLQEWFDELCEKQRPKWNARVQKALRVESEKPKDERRTRADIEVFLANNATTDLQRLEAELLSMLTRTAILVAAATLLFAVYAFKPNVASAATLLALALCFTALSFITSLIPLAPPAKRAFFDKYEKRHEWTLLAATHFERWVLDCWSGDRRTKVITRYKRAHAVAVPVLVIAAVIASYGLTTGFFFG
jgi:hypothetical protein